MAQAKMSLTDLKSGLDLAQQGINTFLNTFQYAFDLGKAGAELEYTRQKFDRLAASIGTTGDALMTDLKQATRGMLSDAELVASAADLMSLGLAKSHDEAVRLAKVSSALGMNMNQLVLTLTNQTTMRFDALGVSVAGFDDKVKALVKSGMSAQDAFSEAFLQQAEEQLAKVGDAADTTLGSFKRLEAATENLGNALKTSLTPMLTRAAEAATILIDGGRQIEQALRDHGKEVIYTAMTYEEYTAELDRAAKAAGYMIDELGNLKRIQQTGGGVAFVLVQENYRLTESEREAAIAAHQAAAAIEEQAEKATVATSVIRNMRAATEAAHGAGRNWADSLYEDNDALDAMRKKADDTAEAVRGIALSFSEMTNARLADTLLADLTEAYQEGKISAEEYRAMSAKVAASLGEVSQKQISASTALFTLQQDYAAGRITLEEYIKAVQDLGAELNGIPKNIQVLIDIKTSGDAILSQLKGGGVYGPAPAPRPATNTGRSTGTPGGYREPGFASGGSFVVPPGYPNDSFVMRVSSGEHVQVTPAGKSGGGGGGVYIENLIISGADSPEATGHAVVSRLRKSQARSGMGDYGGR